ncbi:hypothetical protein AX774_g8178 [Zancudomyces culisetae]|uniref:Uncharacterized protein n=1 Tax=Zancudomyces culisetae TaxID=1213189 RepID=A0A1R1PBV3_ZANCU|nr:hypothetical protein AX774_g8178 [Zancudomyces culisetae]|eukprot:OMH78444.1 hypothetical protein AX774_g8178 [Zancudomyces culisetae]
MKNNVLKQTLLLSVFTLTAILSDEISVANQENPPALQALNNEHIYNQIDQLNQINQINEGVTENLVYEDVLNKLDQKLNDLGLGVGLKAGLTLNDGSMKGVGEGISRYKRRHRRRNSDDDDDDNDSCEEDDDDYHHRHGEEREERCKKSRYRGSKPRIHGNRHDDECWRKSHNFCKDKRPIRPPCGGGGRTTRSSTSTSASTYTSSSSSSSSSSVSLGVSPLGGILETASSTSAENQSSAPSITDLASSTSTMTNTESAQ